MLKAKAFTEVKHRRHSALLCLFVGLASFAAAFGKIMGVASPVNVVIAVITGANVVPAFAGSAIAYILSGSIENGIVQLCSMLVIGGLRLTFMQDAQKDNPIFLGMLSSGVMLLFNCVMSIAVPSDSFMIAMRMVLSLMCGCLVFAAKTLLELRQTEGILELHGICGVFVSMLYLMTVCTLAAVPVPFINIGRVFGCFCVLVAVRKYKTAGGAVMGALTTFGVLLCSPSLAKNTLLLAASGLVCGAFAQFGSLAATAVFIGISLVSLVAIGINGDSFYMLADMLAGTAVFIACPSVLIRKIAAGIFTIKGSADYVGQTASSRISFASKALGEIRSQLVQVTAAMDRKANQPCFSAAHCEQLCASCEMNAMCRKKCLLAENDSFSKIEDVLLKYNCVSIDDISSLLPMCLYPDKLSNSINKYHEKLLADKAESIRIREMRELIAEQLSSMEDILSDLSYRVSGVRNIDPRFSEQIKDYFSGLGYPNSKVCVYSDENNCRRIEVFLTAEFKGDIAKLTVAAGEIAECDFDVPVITRIDNVTRIAFNELSSYTADIGIFQACSTDNGYSGDTVEAFTASPGEKYVVLSDGMGTGKRAKLDSMFSVNLACRLLKSGISMESAHRLINSVLRVKGWDESFATLDFVRLDLCGGSAEFLKAGAVPTLLVRDGSVKKIGAQSFPAGILASCRPDIDTCKLFHGDMLIIASDGAREDVLRTSASLNVLKMKAKDISQLLGEKAMQSYKDKRRDDITIAVIRIMRR